MAELTERQAYELLKGGARKYQAFEKLAEALEMAVQAKERGDKAELRARELETKVEAKQQELQKLATTVLAAEGSAAEYMDKLTASRKAADKELDEYLRGVNERLAEADREYRTKVQEFNSLYEALKRKTDQERAAERTAHERYMEQSGIEIQKKQAKIAELQAIIDEMKRKLGQV